jgi:hypothetical protein
MEAPNHNSIAMLRWHPTQIIYSGFDSPSKNFGIEGAHHLDYKYKVRHAGLYGDRPSSRQ